MWYYEDDTIKTTTESRGSIKPESMIATQDNGEHKCYYIIEVSYPNETNTRLGIEALGNLPSSVVNNIQEILDKHYDNR